MSKKKVPILLSFYGLSNGKRNLFFGKLAYSPVRDLSFKNYSRLKTFVTLFSLYRTHGIRHHKFEMTFDHGVVKGVTDESGSFWCESLLSEHQTQLLSITLDNGEKVSLTEDLYPNRIHNITGSTIVISDLDDTLIHSFISHKFKQAQTLLFTTVEDRKEVTTMAKLIRRFAAAGATPFYLSNSEQNLYPMLYRFLAINKFPQGPMFLRQYIRLGHLVVNRFILRKENVHKRVMLEKILELFPDKKFIMIGDNTQRDLTIYTDAAIRYPKSTEMIIIREVVNRAGNRETLAVATKTLNDLGIKLYYASAFTDEMLPIPAP